MTEPAPLDDQSQGFDAEEESEKGGEEIIEEITAETTLPAQEDIAPAFSDDISQDIDGCETGEMDEIIEEVPEDLVESSIEMKAASNTNNMVGRLFAEYFTDSYNRQENGESPAKYNFDDYPWEHHERSWYGDSLRVRDLSDGKYLVYRDSLLLVSKADSADYSVSYSEDERTAYVTPAFAEEELSGKTGIIFLADFVGDDTILVFDGAPYREDDTLVVPLADPDAIIVNQLFSDASITYSASGENAKKNQNLRSDGNLGWDIHWEKHLSGTNWSGDITDVSVDDISAGLDIKPESGGLELYINFKFAIDFDITTTGSSGGRQASKAADISFPIDVFTVTYTYNVQAEFDEKPIEVAGTLVTDFNYTISVKGGQINEFRTPVTIRSFTVVNDEDYNKDISFYIGSELLADLSVIDYNIDIWFIHIHIGPVLKLTQDCAGGCYITARHEKGLWSPPPDRTKDEIHTCAKDGEEGCLALHVEEKNSVDISFTIDFHPLPFGPYPFHIYSDETLIATNDYYDSYTFQSGMQEGICPHHFYKVPARVWLDDDMSQPAQNMAVTVSDELDLKDVEKDLVKGTTGADGSTDIFLPYKDDYRYTLVASGKVEGVDLAGSKSMDEAIQMKKNPPVDIILKQKETVTVRTVIDWNADIEDKEVPQSGETVWIALESRKADGMSQWEIVKTGDEEERTSTSKDSGFAVSDFTDLPKFVFEDEHAYLLEYRTRLTKDGSSGTISPEKGDPYINYTVGSYVNAAGASEPQHETQYRVDYEDTSAGDIYTTTIKPAPVMDVSVRKLWQLSDPQKQADFVYLALQHKPEEGWEGTAAAEGIPGEWLVIQKPYSTDTNTIRQLESDHILTLIGDAGSAQSLPLTIGKVSDSNSWLVSYKVLKYREGVKMQYQGKELDSSVIEDFLNYEYGISATAKVKSFGDYKSTPGKAHQTGDTAQMATVVNRDPEPENKIS